MKKTLIAFAAVLLAACVTVPSDAPPYRPAPMAEAGSGTLYIYRTGNPRSIRAPDILVNGKLLVEPPFGAYTWSHYPAGSYRIQVKWAADVTTPNLDFNIDIRAGEDYYLRLTDTFRAEGNLWKFATKADRVPKIQAETELTACCRYVKPRI